MLEYLDKRVGLRSFRRTLTSVMSVLSVGGGEERAYFNC